MAAREPGSPRWARVTLVTGVVLALLAGGTAFAAHLVVQRWEGAVGRGVLLAPDARKGAKGAGSHAEPGPARPADGGTAPTGPAPTGPTPTGPTSTGPAPTGPAPTGTPPTGTAGPGASPGPTTPAGAAGAGDDGVEGPLTYLVIGTDRRSRDPADGGRADAIILVHLPAGLREAYLISVPRDLLVPIRDHWPDKINAAYALGGGGSGGAQLLSATLHDLTGVRFDGAAILDFSGFREVIDALGGVELCLDRRVRSIHTGEVFPAGCQHLTGRQALDLARQRYDLPGGDFDRGRNHQRLIRAMIDQVVSADLLTDPLRLDRTIRAVGRALTVDTGDVSLPELAFALRHLRPARITGVTLPSYPETIGGVSYVRAGPAAAGLYRAVRESRLADWVADHPRWRND
jgi:LCP family protein required for cell wall assembly